MTTQQAINHIESIGLGEKFCGLAIYFSENGRNFDDYVYCISEEVSYNPQLAPINHDPIDNYAIALHFAIDND